MLTKKSILVIGLITSYEKSEGEKFKLGRPRMN